MKRTFLVAWQAVCSCKGSTINEIVNGNTFLTLTGKLDTGAIATFKENTQRDLDKRYAFVYGEVHIVNIIRLEDESNTPLY